MATCKYCREHGLHWVYTKKQGWRLYPNNGPVHTCNRGLQAAAARHTRRDLPQSAEERYPEQYARAARQLNAAREEFWDAMRNGGVPPRGSLAGIPTQPMTGPEFEFDNLPGHGAEWHT